MSQAHQASMRNTTYARRRCSSVGTRLDVGALPEQHHIRYLQASERANAENLIQLPVTLLLLLLLLL